MSRAFRDLDTGAAAPRTDFPLAAPLARLEARIAGDPRLHRCAGAAPPSSTMATGRPSRPSPDPRPLRAQGRGRGRGPQGAGSGLEHGRARFHRAGPPRAFRSSRRKRIRPRPCRPPPPGSGPGDIPRDIDRIPREAAVIGACPASLHPLFTNGIVYLDLGLPPRCPSARIHALASAPLALHRCGRGLAGQVL